MSDESDSASHQRARHAEIARDLIHLRSAAKTPVLSPDGCHVACVVSTVDLDENTMRSCIWLDGVPLTAGPDDTQPVWSPDGAHLAFVSRRGKDKQHTTVHVLPVGGPGEMRTLCSMNDGVGDLRWSPDGRHLAFVSRTRDERYDAKDVTWRSPRKIERHLARLDGGERRWISSGLDRTFFAMTCSQAPVWESGETLLAAAEDRGETHLYRVAVGGREPERVTSGALSIHGFDVRDGVLATVRSTVEHGGELWLTRDGDDRRLTHVTTDGVGWETFTVPCSDGTDEIDAWIVRPIGFDATGSHPVLLNVHSGPFTPYGEYYFDEAQMQARAGFGVLMCNPRGGSGRDTAWARRSSDPSTRPRPAAGGAPSTSTT